MKILIISGFLGSGKTTFIKTMTQKTRRDFVVFENEYGQADIDTKLLQSDSGLNIWELTENCVCCTGKADFASSILTISSTLDPEYLIVEPTGAAKLSSLLDNIRQMNYERISLLKPLSIIDGTCFESQKRQYADIYQDQIRAAATIVVSKMEHASPEELEALRAEINAINPEAEVLTHHYTENEEEWWNFLLTRDLEPGVAAVPSRQEFDESRFDSMSLHGVSLPSPTHLIAFLDALSAGVFGRIPRSKGYMQCGKEWLRYDVVDRAWAITGMEPMEDSQCVFIGNDIYRAGLREILQPAMKMRVIGEERLERDRRKKTSRAKRLMI